MRGVGRGVREEQDRQGFVTGGFVMDVDIQSGSLNQY